MSTPTLRRMLMALFAAAALMVGVLAGASAANAKTLYACVKKNGSAHVFCKKPKCKKGESKLSWNTSGPAGKNGANGSNGANGANGAGGAPGQPQSAVAFNVSSEAPFVEKKFTNLFTLGGVTVRLDCANALIANVNSLEALGAAGTRAVSGMTSSKATNEAPTESFQQPVFNVAVTPTGTVFANLVTNGKAPLANVGHVNATLFTSTAVVTMDAFIEIGEGGAKACTVAGTAF